MDAAVFERAFQAFLEKGGFTQPCIDEDVQRRFMATKPRRKCRHGLGLGTCVICNGERSYPIVMCWHGVRKHTCLICSGPQLQS